MNFQITDELLVKNQKVRVIRVNNQDYISLTDLARYENDDNPSDLIKQWMSNKDSFDFYGLWEEFNNSNFNSVEFHRIKNTESGRNRFLMTSIKWNRSN